jgi:hypothetical protein
MPSKITRRHGKLLKRVILTLNNNDKVIDHCLPMWQFFVHQLSGEKPLTVDFLQNALQQVDQNKQYMCFDYYNVQVPLELELGRLVDKETLPKTECSVCMDATVTRRHCTTCRGADKLVCKKCIVRMLTLDRQSNSVYYDCPHCRSPLYEPKWANQHLGALRKIRQLLTRRARV